MLFNSFTFIVFLGIVLLLHYMRLSWKVKKVNLLLASFLFYAMWNPPFVVLLWISIVMDFYFGKKLFEADNKAKRKVLLVVSLLVNLGLLGFFKYGDFLLDNFTWLASSMGIGFTPAKADIILPVGISFYTFQSLSYTMDMYYRKHAPETSLVDYSLFVSFFPHLVAGPIVRQDVLAPQFKAPRQANRLQFMNGLFLLSLGLFMKVVLADTLLAGPADMVFSAPGALATLDAWMGVLAFSGQIFFDFAGYSTCAIGVAAMLGFYLPHNFLYPYAASGFSDFWRRWHISLSGWLRDYLYIPLGGNRKGETRTYVNLMITMLLGGLWHGASWTFVAWGALHGIFLCAERLIRSRKPIADPVLSPVPVVALTEHKTVVERSSFFPAVFNSAVAKKIMAVLLTFFLVNITWVFFRATDFSTAWRLLASMTGFEQKGIALLPTLDLFKVGIIITLMLLTHYFMRNTTVSQLAQKTKWWMVGIVWAILLIAVLLSQKSSDSFIYFQF